MFLKLKSVALFFKILTCFLLPRPFGNISHDVAEKYVRINIADQRKLEKTPIKARKAELN